MKECYEPPVIEKKECLSDVTEEAMVLVSGALL
jgi:hypothetical protein